MTNKKYNVIGSDIILELDDSLLTTGTIGATVSFTFNDEWSGLRKTAVFRGGGVTKSVNLPGDSVGIPWEVLLMEGPLQVGVEGRSADGSIVFPTVWNDKCWVHKGAAPNGDPSVSPTLPIWGTIQKTIGDINDLKTKNKNGIVEAINELVDGGGGHGPTSFIVKVSRSENKLIADHTVSEIIDRIKNAEMPWCYEAFSDISRVFPLVSYNENNVLFGGIQGDHSVLVTISDDGVYISEDTIALSEDLLSIVNKVYELGPELNKKVTSPESGELGDMIVVDDVDENGTPTGWKCVPPTISSSEMHVGDEPPEDENTTVWLDTRNGDSPDYIPTPTTATVGQTIVVKEIDESGKPVSWECADVAGGDKWELISEKIEIEEEITSVAFNVDMDKNPFSLRKMRIFMYLPPETDASAYAEYSINGYGSYSSPSEGWSNISLMCDIESMGCGNTVHIVWYKLGKVKTEETKMWVRYVWQDASLSTIRSFTWALFNRNVMPGTTFEIWGVRA